jgi:hypothetical protein
VDVDLVSDKIGPLSDTMKKFFDHKGSRHVIKGNNKNYIVMPCPHTYMYTFSV